MSLGIAGEDHHRCERAVDADNGESQEKTGKPQLWTAACEPESHATAGADQSATHGHEHARDEQAFVEGSPAA